MTNLKARYISREYKAHLAFWESKLLQQPGPFRFGDRLTSVNEPAAEHAQCAISLGPAAVEAMHKITGGQSLGNLVVLTAALQILMHKLENHAAVVIDTPLLRGMGEPAGLAEQVSLILSVRPEATVKALLEGVKETLLGSYTYQHYPLAAVFEDHAPFLRAATNVLLYCPALHEEPADAGRYDLVCTFNPAPGNGTLVLRYNADLFASNLVPYVQDYLTQIIGAFENPSLTVGNVELLTEALLEKILHGFNQTQAAYPAGMTLHGRYEWQAAQTPAATALRFGSLTLTYAALNQAANRLAAHLRAQFGVGPGQVVGIMADRSERMVIAVLGVLKAGGAYLPIDPAYPRERKQYLLDDAGVQLLLTDSECMYELAYYTGALFALDIQLPDLTESSENPEPLGTAADLAYVIYTSGSTGQPKGVMIEHRNCLNMTLDQIRRFGVNDADGVLQFASFSFDASVSEIWMALYAGATLVLLEKDPARDPEAFAACLRATGVTVATLPPAYLSVFKAADIDFLRVLITAGEAANVKMANQLSQRLHYFNAYGPTECSVCVSIHRHGGPAGNPRRIPIGRPLANTRAYVLDEHRRPVPIGVAGELYVAGAGVARGYLGRDALTGEKFPTGILGAEARMYRTGDLVRWLPGGDLDFLGRIDDQLKIRGHRVEPGEVEKVLVQHPSVGQAVVVAREDGEGRKFLVGYLTAPADTTAEALRQHAQQWLPEYMVPAFLVRLDQFPLTPHGKIDYQKLPSWEQADAGAAPRTAPASETEARLAGIWEEVLRKSPIGTNENFFEIGGNSLNATMIIARVHSTFGVKVKLSSLFDAPTVAGLAACIDVTETSGHEDIEPVAEQPDYELSHAQKGLWLVDQFSDAPHAYNLTEAYAFAGELDEEALDRAFAAFVKRHEILRTTIISVQGVPRQQVRAPEDCRFRIRRVDLRGKPGAGQGARALANREATTAFDLEAGPLLRAMLVHTGDHEYVFTFTMHHIITDGWSMGIMLQELIILYNAFAAGRSNPLHPLKTQYKDYAHWQNARLAGPSADAHWQYWAATFRSPGPVLNLPADYPRPAARTMNGNTINFPFGRELVTSLNKFSQEHKVSLFMTLQAAVLTLLHHYTGQEDITVGSPIAGREHVSLHNQIGYFINTLALRTTFRGSDSFAGLLARVKENTLAAYEHQMYPFDLLVDRLALPRNQSRSPLFDVVVHLLNVEATGREQEDMRQVSVSGYEIEQGTSSFDLSFLFYEMGGDHLGLRVEYNTDLFKEGRILVMFEKFRLVLRQLLTGTAQAIGDYDLTLAQQRDLQSAAVEIDFDLSEALG